MVQKSLTVSNSELFYIDSEKDGLPLLLVHGNSMNAGLFHKLYKSSSLAEYRLIAPDLPGHGKTGKSDDPENDYGVAAYINLLINFIQKLEIKELVIYGHSLGGHIAIHLADELNSAKIRGLLISGTPPLTIPPDLASAFIPGPAMMLGFKGDLTTEEINTLSGSFMDPEHPEYQLVHESIETCDPLVRPLIGQSIAMDLKTDEAEILRKAEFPVAVLHGSEDFNVNKVYIEGLKLSLWKNGVVQINGASHSPFLDKSEEFNSELASFLASL